MNNIIRIVRKTTMPNGRTYTDTIGYLPSRGKNNHEANDEIIASYMRGPALWNWPDRDCINNQMRDFKDDDKVKIGWGIDLCINAVEHMKEFVAC